MKPVDVMGVVGLDGARALVFRPEGVYDVDYEQNLKIEILDRR